MRCCLDSSALAKRYIRERGSTAVARFCSEASEIVVSILCYPELLSAFNRLRRDRILSGPQYELLKRDLAADLNEATVVDVSAPMLPIAAGCLESSPLRALDAIHVATAVACSVDQFVTADRQQAAAARSAGLEVVRISD